MILVSVIITTKNEAANIRNCLISVKNQTYKNVEIIVVDNFSTDNTVEIAKEYTNLVFFKGPERSAQRNFGINKAKGKCFLFLDSDMMISSNVISRAVERLKEDKNLVGLYIPEIILGNSYWCKVRRLERIFYDETPIDGARFIRKDIFERIGGFDVSLTSAEDWDLNKRLKQIGGVKLINTYDFEKINNKINRLNHSENLIKQLKGVSDSALIFHNEIGFFIIKYMAKKSYYCESINRYIGKWGKDDADVKKQFSFVYRYFVVFFEKGKWRRMIKHPKLIIGVFLLRFFVGVCYLRKWPQ